jgi:hypothetical protein
MADDGDAGGRDDAPTGTGHVNAGTPCLTVTFESGGWWFQLCRPGDEAAYVRFLAHHQKPVTPAEVRRYVPKVGALTFAPMRGFPGLPAACEADAGETKVHLNAADGPAGEGLDAAALEAAFRAFMGPDPGGRRLA